MTGLGRQVGRYGPCRCRVGDHACLMINNCKRLSTSPGWFSLRLCNNNSPLVNDNGTPKTPRILWLGSAVIASLQYFAD